MLARFSERWEFWFVGKANIPTITLNGFDKGFNCTRWIQSVLDGFIPLIQGRLCVVKLTLTGISQIPLNQGAPSGKVALNDEPVRLSTYCSFRETASIPGWNSWGDNSHAFSGKNRQPRFFLALQIYLIDRAQ